VANPSVHYLGVEGSTTIWRDHSWCVAQWERIKSERSDEYGDDGAYSHSLCNSHGIRMEGRGWNRDSAANGYDDDPEQENLGSRALCVLVGTEDVITGVCKQGIAVWTEEAYQHGLVPPLRPHSSYVATSCPGDHLRTVIEQINRGEIEGDEVTQEQMDTLGAWMQEQRGALEAKLGQWEQDTRSYVDKQIKASEARIIAALK
jgi:hypothetical protein